MAAGTSLAAKCDGDTDLDAAIVTTTPDLPEARGEARCQSKRRATMSAPVFVTFRHMSPRAGLEDYAREQAGHLDRFYDRIVDCRVLLEPNDAGILRVVVEVTVPGERLVASYESEPQGESTHEGGPPAMAEHRWLHAMHEAFKSAGSALKTYAGRRLTRSRRGALVSR
jgi:hypothetical protein